MINIDEINGEIAKLENQPTTMSIVERLSWLYVVRDHLTISPSSPVTGSEIPDGDSEFYSCCAGKTVCEVMEVMDDLMSALLIIQPRLYSAVLSKLNPI